MLCLCPCLCLGCCGINSYRFDCHTHKSIQFESSICVLSGFTPTLNCSVRFSHVSVFIILYDLNESKIKVKQLPNNLTDKYK